MRALMLYADPVEASFCAALHATAIRALLAITTYGRPRLSARLAGRHPPRRVVTRVLRRLVSSSAFARDLALYDMNRADDRTRAMFLGRIDRTLARLA